MIEKDGNNKVGETHAGKNQSGQCTEGPKRHLELAVGMLRVLQRKDEAHRSHNEADGREYSKNDEKQIVRQGRILSHNRTDLGVRVLAQRFFQ